MISIVVWLSLVVPWVGLQCIILVFHDHTNLLAFFIIKTHNVKRSNVQISEKKCIPVLGFQLNQRKQFKHTCISMASLLDLQCISKNHLQVISQ